MSALFVFALAIASGAAAECERPRAEDPVVLLVVARDPALDDRAADVERAVRNAAAGRLRLLPASATIEALTAEGGREERERAVIDARIVLDRAEEKFRELDDEEALNLIARATTQLSAVHHAAGAIEQLSRAHLLAGAIYLARGRADAARQRLQRALDLDPGLSPPRDRFSPEVLAEIAGVRASQTTRATGRLIVRSGSIRASVFIDGHRAGETPLELDAVGTGNHLLRVYAAGHSSAISSIQLGPNEEELVEVTLLGDPEQALIESLRSRAGSVELEAMKLFAQRASAERTLLATVELADETTASGTATIAVTLDLERTGTAIAKTIAAQDVGAALDRALACAHEQRARDRLAPSLIGRAEARTTPLAPVPPPTTLADQPWFWGAVFVATLAAASAFVIARSAGGPPDAVEVTLIPRP